MNTLKSLVVALLAMAMLIATAGAAPARMHFVPSDRDVRLTGHGYGHGIGMSQYGAEGAARQGRSWQQIVGFYYPGTTVGNSGGMMRVLVTDDTSNDVRVRQAPGLSIRDLGARRAWELPRKPGGTQWRINPGTRWVQFGRPGSWKRWKQMRGNSEFYRPGRKPVALVLPGGQVRHYRDRLRSIGDNTVNALPLEQYLRGVVPREMPASWSSEALQSQAVAARTYAIRLRAQHPRRYYQICDTVSCQVYAGADAEHPRTDAAIRGTARKVLRYRGDPALTMFSSSNGGRTADGNLPYLVAKRDPWDGWSGNPMHRWTKTVRASAIESAYPSIGRLIAVDVLGRSGGGRWGGRVERLLLDGTRGDVTISGTDMRFGFGLRSHWFKPASTGIGRKWRRLGGESSRVGGTRGAEYATNGGAGQVFDDGRIYWSRRSHTHEVYGAILTRYLRMRGAQGVLGFPTTGEVNGGVPGSRMNEFQGGRIYWSRATGAHEVYGGILRRYLELGAADSRLRLPTTGEYSVPGGRAGDFQGGRLVWDRSSNRVTVHYR